MNIYFVILLIVMSISLIGSHNKYGVLNGVRLQYNTIYILPLIIITIILICFQGFRNISVGTDTGGYCLNFMEHGGWWEYEYKNISSLFEEPGLYVLYKIAAFFSDADYLSFLIVTAIVMVPCSIIALKRASICFSASLFTYISLAYYLFGFAGIRQACALSFLLLAYTFLYQRSLGWYLFFVCVGILFHKTLVIALPVYFLTYLRYNLKNVLIIGIVALLIGGSMEALIDWGASIEHRYEYYEEETAEGSGSLLALFSVCITLFYMYVRREIPKSRYFIYDPSLFLLIIASCIFLIVTMTGSNTELNRFATYFQISTIFLMSEYVWAVKDKKGINFLLIGVVLAQLVYYSVYVSKISGINLYMLNPSIITYYLY